MRPSANHPSQCLTHLHIFCECPKHLFGYLKCLEEVLPPRNVDGPVVSVVPIEIRDGLLQAKQVVHCAHNDIYGGGVASLCPQVVLEGEVVPLTQELEEQEKSDGEGIFW